MAHEEPLVEAIPANFAFDMPVEERPEPRDMDYHPADLFPEAGEYRKEGLHDYVKDMLVEAARAKTLTVTDLINQPNHLRDIAGMVVFGQYLDFESSPAQMKDNGIIPPELQQYPIKVRLLPDPGIMSDDGEGGKHKRTWPATIQWKRALEKRKLKTIERRSKNIRSRWNKVQRLEPVHWNTQKTEAILPLPYAWQCLNQHGKYCRWETDKQSQIANWWYTEVFVCPKCGGEYEPGDDHECKKGPGRPRKAG